MMSAREWLSGCAPKARARVRLFCFPHAGGGALAYRGWSERLGDEIEVRPVQLPGRENRIGEAPAKRLEELLPRLVEVFADDWDAPFALFGHSMGALIAFELARELRRTWHRTPECLFVSGRLGPRELDPDPPLHDLPDAELGERLMSFNGTPPAVLEHPELIELLFPTLRADFEICACYSYRPEPPLACPITVLGGRDDTERPRERLTAWKDESTGPFSIHVLPGDHFFLRSAEARVLEIVRERLEEAGERRFSIRGR